MRGHATALLQRKCACGQHTAGGEQCAECKKKGTMQRRAASQSGPAFAPPIVHEVLRSPGQPLDRSTRNFMEPRFGQNFSHVRVHTDTKAAESAQAVNALAYTVGSDVVFGLGQFRPKESLGQRLIAHELTHVAQQAAGLNRQPDDKPLPPLDLSGPARDKALDRQPNLRPHIPRAPASGGLPARPGAAPPCSADPRCQLPIPGSAWDFSHKVDTKAQENRQAQAADPALAQAAGTSRRAVELEKVINAAAPGLMTGVAAIWVNPSLAGTGAGGQAGACDLMNPPPADPNAVCIEVLNSMENEAATYNDPKQIDEIGGKPREAWLFNVVRTLTHEMAHVAFDKGPPAGITTRDEVSMFELSELSAQLSEFPVGYRVVMSSAGSETEKNEKIRQAIKVYIERPGEGIRGMLTKLRCISPCDDVNKSVTAVFNAQTSGWPAEMRTTLLNELADPENHLGWPMLPVPTVQRPLPDRPKFPPLYVPRTSFAPEMTRTGENL